jgi:hypothetical protein
MRGAGVAVPGDVLIKNEVLARHGPYHAKDHPKLNKREAHGHPPLIVVQKKLPYWAKISSGPLRPLISINIVAKEEFSMTLNRPKLP